MRSFSIYEISVVSQLTTHWKEMSPSSICKNCKGVSYQTIPECSISLSESNLNPKHLPASHNFPGAQNPDQHPGILCFWGICETPYCTVHESKKSPILLLCKAVP